MAHKRKNYLDDERPFGSHRPPFRHVLWLTFISLAWLGIALLGVPHAKAQGRSQPQPQPMPLPLFQSPVLPQAPGLHTGTRDYASMLINSAITPPDTSSPRATMESFLVLTDKIATQWNTAIDALEADGDVQPQELEQTVAKLLDKSLALLDLTGIPDSSRHEFGLETLLQFREILVRMPPVDLSRLPGGAAGSFLDSSERDALPVYVSLPGTSVVIERVAVQGDSSNYLLSAKSVRRMHEEYLKIKDDPVVRRGYVRDLYAYYIFSPGYLLPPQWFDLVLLGPDWLFLSFADQAIWQWLMLLTLVLSLLFVVNCLVRLAAWMRRSKSLQGMILTLVVPLVLVGLIQFVVYFANEQINITGMPLLVLRAAGVFSEWVAIACLSYLFFDAVAKFSEVRTQGDKVDMNANLMRSFFRLVGILSALLIVAYGLTQIGISVVGVVAGVSVSGLAIALAARLTLENILGGLIIYADQSLKIGEYINAAGIEGVVESVGIRSTRIRTPENSLLTIGNAVLAAESINNHSRGPGYPFRQDFPLHVDCRANQIDAAIARIGHLLADNSQILADGRVVQVAGLNDSGLVLRVGADVSSDSRASFLEEQSRLILGIKQVIEAQGLTLADPSGAGQIDVPEGPEGTW